MQEKGPYFVMWVSYQAKLFISDVDISIVRSAFTNILK